MVHLMPSKNFHRWTKEFGHAFLVLIVTIVISVLLGEFAFMRGWGQSIEGCSGFSELLFPSAFPSFYYRQSSVTLVLLCEEEKGFLFKLEENKNWKSIL